MVFRNSPGAKGFVWRQNGGTSRAKELDIFSVFPIFQTHGGICLEFAATWRSVQVVCEACPCEVVDFLAIDWRPGDNFVSRTDRWLIEITVATFGNLTQWGRRLSPSWYWLWSSSDWHPQRREVAHSDRPKIAVFRSLSPPMLLVIILTRRTSKRSTRAWMKVQSYFSKTWMVYKRALIASMGLILNKDARIHFPRLLDYSESITLGLHCEK